MLNRASALRSRSEQPAVSPDDGAASRNGNTRRQARNPVAARKAIKPTSLRRVLPYLFIVAIAALWLTVLVRSHDALRSKRGEPLPNHRMAPSAGHNATHKSSRQQGREATEFSACLLVMDDNHYLIEWLAYHYHVLNLRTVVIVSDPRSLTSPTHVLDRWRQRMEIIEWHDSNFMTDRQFEEAKENVRNFFSHLSPQLTDHRARQRLFFGHCLKYLKSERQQSWALMADTDEYLSLNYQTLRDADDITIDVPPISQPGSVAAFIEQMRGHDDAGVANVNGSLPIDTLLSSPCIQIPRIRYGSMETLQQADAAFPHQNQHQHQLSSFNASRLSTWRWRCHAPPHDHRHNKISKTLIDVSRVPDQDLVPAAFTSIHIPIRSMCTQRRLHVRTNQSYLMIRHYLGSYEQYMYRANDARDRTREQYDRNDVVGRRVRCNDDVNAEDIRAWLSGFIDDVGKKDAAELLRGAGQLDVGAGNNG